MLLERSQGAQGGSEDREGMVGRWEAMQGCGGAMGCLGFRGWARVMG